MSHGADKTMLIKLKGHEFFMAQVYVDDIIFGESPPASVIGFVDQMQSKFEMSMVGELVFFWGFQIC